MEVERNLALKALEALDDYRSLQEVLRAEVASPPENLVIAAAEVVAWKDAVIVAGAVHAHVAFIATYDRRHILSQRETIQARFGITAATPEEILRT